MEDSSLQQQIPWVSEWSPSCHHKGTNGWNISLIHFWLVVCIHGWQEVLLLIQGMVNKEEERLRGILKKKTNLIERQYKEEVSEDIKDLFQVQTKG